jgi:carbon monoxide dehydrogenase subunit G
MALRAESSVDVDVAPEAVFPWLLEEEKVRRWQSGLERYERADAGPLRVGSRIHENLLVSGYSLALELEVVALEPPQRADLRFEGSGFKALNRYRVAPAPGGARVTWALEGDATSFKARLISSMVQAKLQEKLDGDLARLRDLLASEPAAA